MFIFKLNCKFQCLSVLYIAKAFKSKHALEKFVGIKPFKIKQFTKKHGLENVTEDHIKEIVEFCEVIGITREEVKKNAQVLKMNLRQLDSQYTLMKEFGFKKIDIPLLIMYRKCMNRPVSLLKAYDLIDKDANVVENMLSQLKPSPDNIKKDDLTDDWIAFDIHKTLLTRYLMWRFDKTQEEIESFLRRKDAKGIRSFRFISESLELAKDLNIKESDMLKRGYLVAGYPKYPLTTITECDTICGAKVTELYQREPKLISVSPKNMKQIKDILESYNITREGLLNNLRILMFSPSTIKLRFEELEKIPELKVLINHKRVLSLVSCHNKVRSRLSFLRDLNLKCTSFGVIGDHFNTFDNHLKCGKDQNSFYDLKILLQKCFSTDYKEVQEHLKRHPFYLKVPLTQMLETFEYLKTKEYETDAIKQVIHILLYPKEKIEKAFSDIYSNNHLRFTYLDDIQKLNLVLYFLEKRHHFSGNGIWKYR